MLGVQTLRASTRPRPFLRLSPQHLAVQVLACFSSHGHAMLRLHRLCCLNDSNATSPCSTWLCRHCSAVIYTVPPLDEHVFLR